MASRHTRITVVALAVVILATGVSLEDPILAGEASPAPATGTIGLAYPADTDLGEHASWAVVDEPAESAEAPGPDDALRALTSAADRLSPEAWDPDALAATFDGDPEKAFAFVRDSIGLDPYRGVLRGAAGTLAARAGSTADRALLLAGLLDAMGFTTRFASADLDAAVADELLARSLTSPSAPLEPAPPVDAGLLDRVAVRAHRDHALLRSALGDLVSQLGAAPEPDALARLGRHTWVQLDRDGRWIDLDPTLLDAVPGDVLAPAAVTADTIPAAERATVAVRVVAENLIDGVVSPMVALDQTLDVADAAGEPVLLLFQGTGGGGGGMLGGVGLPTAYEPLLWAAGRSFVGAPVPVLSTDDPFFGSGSDIRLTRLALELVATSPGRDPVTSERTLLDRVPSTSRALGGWTADDLGPMPVVGDLPAVMLGAHQVVLSTGGADPVAGLESSIGAVFVAAELAKAEEAGREPPEDLPLGTMLLPLTSFGGQLALISERAIVAQLDESVAGRTFIGGPRVFLVSMGPSAAAAEAVEVTTDLALDGLDVASGPSADAAPSAALQRLWYGAAQTALETELVLRVGQALLEQGRTLDGVSLHMLQPLSVVGDASATNGAPGTLAEAVHDGAIGVVPGDVATARLWWTIDRSDGSTRSILDPGIRAGLIGGFPGGFPPAWGGDWVGHEWIGWEDKTVRRRRCGGGNESLEVTECVVAPTTRQLGLMYVKLMRSYAQFLVLG